MIPMAKVKIGDIAPDFTLPSQTGEKNTLSQFFCQFRPRKHINEAIDILNKLEKE